MKGVEPRKTFNTEEHHYKYLSHMKDINNMIKQPIKTTTPYADAQFEKDFKKWVAKTKYKKR